MMHAMGSLEAFQSLRRLLFAIAYRMLGSATEAEDVVQEAWLRWHQANPAEIESPKAWLSTVVTRLCLDHLKSARVQREEYVGPWLPEPIRTDGAGGTGSAGRGGINGVASAGDADARSAEPMDTASISLAFLVLLESLTPAERAVYLLREVFDYSHAEVAAIVGKEEATCRQLHHRARAHVCEGRPRFAPTRREHERLLGSFVHAITMGDLEGLKQVLAEDATLWSDGGGKVLAARNPIHGGTAIARFFVGIIKKAPPGAGQSYEILTVNGWPALVGRMDGVVNMVLDIETDGHRIVGVRSVLNPDKLRSV